MAVRVLGIDPGLTRCGIGVVELGTPNFVRFGVARTTARTPHGDRLVSIARTVFDAIDEYRPDVIGLERLFAQHNVNTVMGVAQISGLVIHEAAKRGIPLELVTPTEVKAAVTGYGAADKRQVTTMVTRLLALEVAPTPADAADALAIAIAVGRRQGRRVAVADEEALTPAQRAWLAAERSARTK
ncbi:crossover junction endodeoxyribonuclease RuvC [Gryllotalpicola sp.]|uniref:crossover junction endodeoxyribonuclease RuvC n=1 Tax=Gryllotalpicola sp. TaxID=1932787 RepID=UPI002608087A|nr:crossover junction endodeoxyribonuclease RuvC [Gryllotalpicola sp.]